MGSRARTLAAAAFVVAIAGTLAFWGFTVDDALIPLRYAAHLRSGAGYRFNVEGPATDGVTPLAWAPVLALLAGGDGLLAGLDRAKVVGLVAWAFAATALGAALGREIDARDGSARRAATLHGGAALGVLALAFPVAAWAVSGMETGVATALATLAAVSFGRERRAAVLAGLAAALRPELVVWAAFVAGGAAAEGSRLASSGARGRRLGLAVAIAGAPFFACVLVRLVAFGRAAPLALLAKPSDLSHGLRYALAASVFVLTPILALAPWSILRATARTKTLALAGVAHLLVVIAVGGDWMPYARLVVPIAPGLALVHVGAARVAHPLASVARLALSAVVGVLLLVNLAPAGRHVQGDRADLVARARPVLGEVKVVAALDIGWVSAAVSERATIVDLAGLTDPEIAALPGGHTSKAVDVGMLLEREVDAVVVYSPPRLVERRIRDAPLFTERFEKVADLPLGTGPHRGVYAIWKRKPR
jgi:hypothetical protein